MQNFQKSVLLFTLEYPPFKGGVANVYSNIVKYWNSTDEIKVLTGKKLLKTHWLFSIWHLYRVIKKNNIQTVLVGHILPLGTISWFLQKFIRFDYVVFLHGMDLTAALKVPRKKKLAVKILIKAKKIIAMNSYVANLVKENFGEEMFKKIAVVNPGVDISIKHQASSIKQKLVEKYNLENKKILLQVGRLVKRKGVDKALEALSEIVEEAPNLVYIIVGYGEEISNIQYLISKYHIEDRVTVITDASDAELDTFYELCDIFIMSARNIDGDFEGFGIVYLEANAHGKPVVAGDSGGVRDAVRNGVNGLLVNSESVTDIRDAIIKLCKDEKLAKKLGEQGREWVKKFVWKKQVAKIKQIVAD